jgi:hypothetical protein
MAPLFKRKVRWQRASRGLVANGGEEAVAGGDGGRIPTIGNAEFVEEAGHVIACRARGDKERGRNLRVGVTLREQLQHFAFAFGQADRQGLEFRRRGGQSNRRCVTRVS